MQLKDVIKTCCQMGQIEVPSEIFSDETDYRDDVTANRVVLCCNLALTQLHWQLNGDASPRRLYELNDEVVLPANSDQTASLIEEIYCFGVLSEYFLQTQDFSCFKLWNERFQSALETLRLSKNYKPLPTGRWI